MAAPHAAAAAPPLAAAARWLCGCFAAHVALSHVLPASSRRFSALDGRRAGELVNNATAALHAAACFVDSAVAIAPLLDLGHPRLFPVHAVQPNSAGARLWMARMCGYLCAPAHALHAPPAA
jgi:hypothetical protein